MDLRGVIHKRAAEVAKPRWRGEMGVPPRGHVHTIVGYQDGKARGACGTLFRLYDNAWLEREDDLVTYRYACPRCVAKIVSGAVEDVR